MINLVVRGKVVKFAEIHPKHVRLEGKVGTPVTMEIEILQNKDYPFVIIDILTKRDDVVRCELVKQCSPVDNSCILRVENLKTTSGRYSDAITIRTDNVQHPYLIVPVVGIIH